MGEGINVYILFSESGISRKTYSDPEENQKVLINRCGISGTRMLSLIDLKAGNLFVNDRGASQAGQYCYAIFP